MSRYRPASLSGDGELSTGTGALLVLLLLFLLTEEGHRRMRRAQK